MLQVEVPPADLDAFVPDLVIINAGGFPANRYVDGVSSSCSVDLHLGRYSKRFGRTWAEMVILGTQYDAVVVATEALAVPHVLAKAAPVFAQVPYQASSIVLHHDESFMPARKSVWSTLNVERQPSSEMSQLTVWLNQYYPAVRFARPTFETWNPLRTAPRSSQWCHEKKEEGKVKSTHFQFLKKILLLE